MKVFLMIVSFLVFSFLGAEEQQTPAQDQNNNSSEAVAEAQTEAPAEEAQEAAPAAEPAQEAAPAEAAEQPTAEAAEQPAAEAAEQPAAEEPKTEEPAKESEVKEPDQNQAPTAEDEHGYNMKLRALEEKIDSLKDKIFKSKQRLAILQETVLGGTVGGSTVTIIHNNEVDSLFKLVSAVYYFDDKPIFKKVDLPEELVEKEIQVYDAAVVPGPHRISVYFVYIGQGYGVFSYLKDYAIKITADQSFTLEEGDIVEIEASAFDKGGMYSFENRIGVELKVNKNTFENRDSAQKE
ncbi:hypothetical protein J6W78_04090 [bacterium]|nr:hypothetical protein [bacterium]